MIRAASISTTYVQGGKHMSFFKIFATILMTFMLTACFPRSTVYKATPLDTNKSTVITMDAKQRSILSMPYQSKGNGSFLLARFCAEPSPDVFTAIASSLGAAIEAKGDIKAETIGLNAKIATTFSENASTIERTQTINILRESMYRTCERYLSGAIDGTELVIQAARDQRTIVSILAIEQLTGVSKAQATALTTVAQAASATENAVKLLADAKAALEKAKKTEQEKLDAANALEPKDTTCEDFSKTEPPADETEEQKKIREAKLSACEAHTTAQSSAQEAQKYYDLIVSVLEKASNQTATAQGTLNTAASQSVVPNDLIVRAVQDIVSQNNLFDEVKMTCVALLRQSAKLRAEELLAVPKDERDEAIAKQDILFKACSNLVTALIEEQATEVRGRTKGLRTQYNLQ